MRMIGLAEAKAQLSALIDAVQAGDEVVITRRGQAVARLVRDLPCRQNDDTPTWPQRFRDLHPASAPMARTAVELVRELREEI
jgi:antitoxin (DNA-binding transcriptional repressor) of toxin-antitoxin stability system